MFYIEYYWLSIYIVNGYSGTNTNVQIQQVIKYKKANFPLLIFFLHGIARPR